MSQRLTLKNIKERKHMSTEYIEIKPQEDNEYIVTITYLDMPGNYNWQMPKMVCLTTWVLQFFLWEKM